MNKLLTFLKKVAVGMGKVILALLFVFALYIAYGIYAEKSASRKAANICASVSPGDETSGLREKAISDGASEFQSRWFNNKGTDILFITYVGLPPFSRHICRIEAKEGRVISAKLTYLD